MFKALVSLLNEREKTNRCMRRRISLSLRFAPISSGAPARANFLQMAGGRNGWKESQPNRLVIGIYYRVCGPAGSHTGGGSRWIYSAPGVIW